MRMDPVKDNGTAEKTMTDLTSQRQHMVATQIHARGVRDKRVLEAMGKVRREAFVSPAMRDLVYVDSPLPIACGQTISQPYIVAFMIEALILESGQRVLEIGAGSGYAAAVLAEIAGEVYAIERFGVLAEEAASHLASEGYENVHIRHADGSKGWIEAAPFDAILVSAGAPEVPEALARQLAVGGRMVVPVGDDPRAQELIRVTRTGTETFDREDLAEVRFVPLIGEEGWEAEEPAPETARPRLVQTRPRLSGTPQSLISRHGEGFDDLETADLGPLLDRIGDARVVLIGEASHGTSEFYRMRARITQRLIEEKAFNIVAAEADWPDAARIDGYVRHRDVPSSTWEAFARFPTWMWRNEEVRTFVDWLHKHNSARSYDFRCGFFGLDLYSLYVSIKAVIDYLDNVDSDLAMIARHRYGCLSPWEADPAAYGHAALTSTYRSCERDVADMLVDLFSKRQDPTKGGEERFFDATRNAKLVADAERYYRTMYYGSRAAWNLRDTHMFETLQDVMSYYGDHSKAVIWAHNSHIGDASATEMSARGEYNIGELCRRTFGRQSYHIGFGTDHGTVAAASSWDGPMEIKAVRPSHPQSYERLFHLTNQPGLLLPLRPGEVDDIADELATPRLERAIGVIYRPETELASHYFEAQLARQFDDYIWIDKTTAITPLPTGQIKGVPDTYPFGV